MKVNGAAWCLACGVLLLPAGVGGQTGTFEPVTDATLQDPAPGDWLNYRRTLDGWGYSPLDQIDRGNVHGLQLVWSWALAPGISEPTPLVYDGVMYLPDGGGSGILALDAVTGELLWEYHKEFEEPPDLILLNPLRRRTRNIAIYGERIYWISYDAHLIALDARTGALVWDRTLVDFRHGYRMTSGPIVVNGLIVSGLAGCDRFQTDKCFISAYDAETGERVWSTPTIALPGQPGDWSWGDVPALERAGGDAWIPGSYDPELGLIYWATAQAKPFTRFQRGTTGDVLFTNSVLALDPETGEHGLVPATAAGGDARPGRGVRERAGRPRRPQVGIQVRQDRHPVGGRPRVGCVRGRPRPRLPDAHRRRRGGPRHLSARNDPRAGRQAELVPQPRGFQELAGHGVPPRDARPFTSRCSCTVRKASTRRVASKRGRAGAAWGGRTAATCGRHPRKSRRARRAAGDGRER